MRDRAFYVGGRRSVLTDLGLKTAAEPDVKESDPYTGLKAVGLAAAGRYGGPEVTKAVKGSLRRRMEEIRRSDSVNHAIGEADAPEAYSKKLIDTHASTYKPMQVGWDPRKGPHYMPSTHSVNADPRIPTILAHELGHAELRENMPRLGKAINTARGLRVFTPHVALGAGAFAPGENHPGYVAGASALSSLPTFVDEGYASLKGLKNLRNTGYKGNAMPALGLAFGTYLTGALKPIARDVAGYELGRGARHLYGKMTGDE